jgi:cystathionine beta-synthase
MIFTLFFFYQSLPEPPILDTILDHIGNTPLVRINNITKSEGIECEICKIS